MSVDALCVGGTIIAVVLSSSPVAAQHASTRPEVFIGLAAQPDGSTHGTPGGDQVQLSPIGVVAGLAVRHDDDRAGAFTMNAKVAVFPVIMRSVVTEVSSGASSRAVSTLTLGSVTLDWIPATARTRSWPFFFSIGAARAFDSPTSDMRDALVAGVGLVHRLTNHVDLKGSMEILAPAIGKTFAQIPVTASFHP